MSKFPSDALRWLLEWRYNSRNLRTLPQNVVTDPSSLSLGIFSCKNYPDVAGDQRSRDWSDIPFEKLLPPDHCRGAILPIQRAKWGDPRQMARRFEKRRCHSKEGNWKGSSRTVIILTATCRLSPQIYREIFFVLHISWILGSGCLLSSLA